MAPNAYEVLRRAAKVERLVHVIDARAARAGYDPHGDPGKVQFFRDRDKAESFAGSHKLYGEPCRVEVVGGEERGAA